MGLFGRKKRGLPSVRIDVGQKTGLVSVVLPVYNGEDYLAEAIASVQAQTYPFWELIIIDDGSLDRSFEIAMDYAKADERISVVHQENQKLPQALNHGFSLAGGEFYTWISADNRFLPDFLRGMVEELRKNPQADMVFANQFLIDEKGERILGHGWFELPQGGGAVCFPPATPMLNIVANNTIGAAFLYRAGCDAVLGGYSPHLFLLEDYDYFMRMNSLFSIRHRKSPKADYEYRFHRDSLTAHDEEYGITASRPKLMEFDACRRKQYKNPVEVSMENLPAEIRKPLLAAGLVQKEDAPLLVWGKPKQTEDYGILPQPKGAYLVYQGKEPLARLESKKDMAEFLRLKLLCERLRQEEKEIF